MSTDDATPLRSLAVPELRVSRSGVQVLGGPGAAIVTQNGELRIEVRVIAEARTPEDPDLAAAVSIAGTAVDGTRISAEQAEIVSSQVQLLPETFSDLTFTAGDLRLEHTAAPGADWTSKVLYLKGLRPTGPTKWTFKEWHCELLPAVPFDKQRADRVTSRLTFTRTGALPDYCQLRAATLALLGLANRLRPRVVLEETCRDADVLESRASPSPTTSLATHPLIPRASWQSFLERCTPTYLAKADDYSLDTVLAYYCRSHSEQFAEFKFIFACVTMEALKFFWAKNVAGLPQDRKQNGLIRGFKRPTNGNFNFAELMNQLAAHLGLTHSYTFFDNRNALFHSGRAAPVQLGAATAWPTLRPELEKLHDQVDDVLLTVLDYHGPIRSYWNQNDTVVFPGRT